MNFDQTATEDFGDPSRHEEPNDHDEHRRGELRTEVETQVNELLFGVLQRVNRDNLICHNANRLARTSSLAKLNNNRPTLHPTLTAWVGMGQICEHKLPSA